MFLEALRATLLARGFAVIGVVDTGLRAVALAQRQRPDVAVLDIWMPGMSGIEAAREIRRVAPPTEVVLVTGYAEEHVVQEALRAGVRGLVAKAQGMDDLLQAIGDVSHGAMYVSPCYSHAVLHAFARHDTEQPHHLTSRELTILRLTAEGKVMKQAAAELGISVRTAEWHRASLMRKLGIHDTAGLVRYAIRQGLIVA